MEELMDQTQEQAAGAQAAGTEGGEAPKRKKLRLPRLPKTEKGRRRFIAVTAVVLVLALCFGIIYKANVSGSLNGQSGFYQVVKAERRDMTVAVSGTATLEPADSYNVTTLLSGEIQSAPFEEGDLVSRGEVLFEMDSTDAQTSVDRADISVEQAQLSYDQAREALQPTSPITGTINELHVRDGDSVTAGTLLAEVVASTDLTIDFIFPYVDPSAFYIGQDATIFIGDFDAPVHGAVAAVSDSTSVTSNGMKTCTVRVKLTNPGVVSSAYTAKAVIGSYSSYGNATISMPASGSIYATGSGTIQGLTKLSGSTIQKGEVLCTVESESIRNQIENAALALENAKLSASTAEDSLEDYIIESQIDGTVIEKNFKAGDKVEGMSSGNLAVIYDMSYLKMSIGVDELDIGKVQVGQEVEITADALPGETFTGVVDKISINGSTVGGSTSYPVTVVLEDYGDLKPGMNVSAKIISERAEDVLCIPVEAVRPGNTVYVPQPGALSEDGATVVDNRKVGEQSVSIGRNDEEYVEITDGLKEGDTVLIFNKVTSVMDMMMGG